MSLVMTPAVVLRTYRYSETSKVVRLATRDLGVQSAIAKGALRPKSRFGAGLELLSEGMAQLYHRDSRELQTLAAFDVEQLRRELALDLGRFAAAAALAELMVQLAPPAPLPAAYDALIAGLDALVRVPLEDIDAAGLRALWGLLGVLGFEPSLRRCVRDGTQVEADGAPVVFSTADGGVRGMPGHQAARDLHSPSSSGVARSVGPA
jgi:DNA repair protein RecO (recombination protein O)